MNGPGRACLQLGNRTPDPPPHKPPIEITTSKPLIRALSGYQLGNSAVLLHQQIGGSIDVKLADRHGRLPSADH